MNISKKVFISTMYTLNYGNRLQNYALTRVLSKMGYDVDTITWKPRHGCFKHKIGFFFHMITKNRYANTWWRKYYPLHRYFNNFDKNINIRFRTNIKKAQEKCDYIVVGSDQVWNPSWNFDDHWKSFFFLTEIPNEKKIAYAASIGIDEIPLKYKSFYKEYLSKFRAISVREARGREILYEEFKLNSKIVLDPTLLLTKEEWEQVEKKPRGFEKKLKKNNYILVYSLDENGLNDEKRNYIRRLSQGMEYEVVELFSDEKISKNIGPAEFVYLIHYAGLVITDSFHASVFSFLFGKTFLILKREDEDMWSRLDGFIKKFSLTNRIANLDNYNLELINNYAEGYEILAQERKKSLDYLQSIL